MSRSNRNCTLFLGLFIIDLQQDEGQRRCEGQPGSSSTPSTRDRPTVATPRSTRLTTVAVVAASEEQNSAARMDGDANGNPGPLNGAPAPDPVPASDDIQDGDDLNEFHEDDAEEVIVLDGKDGAPPPVDEDDDSGSSDSDDDEGDTAMADAGAAAAPVRDDAVLVLRQHKEDALCLAASPTDRRMLLSGGQDDVGALWDLEEGGGAHVGEVDGGGESVSTVAFSADGAYAAFGSENGAIAVVLMNNAEAPREPLDGPGDAVHFLDWHPRGPLLLAGSADCVCYMWNAAKAKFMMAFAGHEAPVTAGGFSGDGKLVLTASMDMSVRVWNPSSGETLRRVQNGMAGIGGVFHTADVMCLTVGPVDTPAAKLVATGCGGGDVFVTQVETGLVVKQLQGHVGGVESVAFSAAEMRPVLLATGGGDGAIHVWDAVSGTERCRFEHAGVTVKVVWHPRRPVLATGSSDGSVALWDALGGKRLALFHGHEDFVTDLCFAGGDDFIASSSADTTVRIFDIRPMLADGYVEPTSST